MVVPGTNCSQKEFGKFFGPKKGQYRDKYPKKNFYEFFS
jgi:hypothetical protein